MDNLKKDLSFVKIHQLKRYVDTYLSINDQRVADQIVEEFLNNYLNWKESIGYIVQGMDGDRLYGEALCVFAGNLYFSKDLSIDSSTILKNELIEYENKVHFMYEIKYALYLDLVLCLNKLSLVPINELKGYLKKSIFYSIAIANNKSYQVDCYAYRSVENNYIIDSFKNETLSMSSPSTFNDPFDCPILVLLTLYGDEISKLVKESYDECLKITCFVKNYKVEPVFEKLNKPKWIPKHDNDPEEYLNELMWAHYANNHKGICIKYHFNNDITKFADNEGNQIIYFRDVNYTSDMDIYRKNGAINLKDAFFSKGKAWEYENELRLISFNLNNNNNNYESIEAKDSIAAIYFGLKCPKEKQEEIINILKGHKWIIHKKYWDKEKNSFSTLNEEYPVDFFKMEIDENHFGKLKPVKIEINEK